MELVHEIRFSVSLIKKCVLGTGTYWNGSENCTVLSRTLPVYLRNWNWILQQEPWQSYVGISHARSPFSSLHLIPQTAFSSHDECMYPFTYVTDVVPCVVDRQLAALRSCSLYLVTVDFHFARSFNLYFIILCMYSQFPLNLYQVYQNIEPVAAFA